MAYDITLKLKPEFLRDMTQEGLDELLNQAQKRFYELRCQCSPHGRTKFVPHSDLFKKVKKDIARIKTIMAEQAR